MLARADAHRGVRVFGAAQALQDAATAYGGSADGDQWDREERAALRRVPGLSTELEDVTEVEYRQLRLENVVLVGVHPQGEQTDAENSLRELAALAETAGAVVLDGVLQRRPHPDPATYVGRGKAQGYGVCACRLAPELRRSGLGEGRSWQSQQRQHARHKTHQVVELVLHHVSAARSGLMVAGYG